MTSPPVTLWWRTFMRVVACSSPFVLLAVTVRLSVPWSLADASGVRVGHCLRALWCDSSHVPAFVALVACVAATVASCRRPRRMSRAVFACGLSALGLLTIDFALRTAAAHQYVTSYPTLGWWTGQGGWRQRGGGSINPQGFRDVRETPRRCDGPRVVCIGDSFTFGDGLADPETWCLLAEQATGVPWINAGVDAYGIDQAALLYEERIAPSYAHTHVVACAIMDDGFRATETFCGPRRKPYVPVGSRPEPVSEPFTLASLSLAPESPVLEPWRRNFRQLGMALGILDDARPHVRDCLRRVRSAAGGRRVTFLALSTPTDRGNHLSTLASLARDAGIASIVTVDLAGCYQPDGHPDRNGARRIAAANESFR